MWLYSGDLFGLNVRPAYNKQGLSEGERCCVCFHLAASMSQADTLAFFWERHVAIKIKKPFPLNAFCIISVWNVKDICFGGLWLHAPIKVANRDETTETISSVSDLLFKRGACFDWWQERWRHTGTLIGDQIGDLSTVLSRRGASYQRHWLMTSMFFQLIKCAVMWNC